MEDLKKVLKGNLISIVKYKVGFEEKMLFVLKRMGIETLEKIKPHFKENYLFLMENELRDGLDVFPLEFLNIRNNYELVEGIDVIKELKFDKRHIRRELEFEFRSKLIHLREQYLFSKGKQLGELIVSAIPTLMPILEGMLFLKGIKRPGKMEEIFDLIGEEYDEKISILKKIEELKKDRVKIKKEEIKSYIKELIVLLSSLGEKLDKLKI